MEIFQFSILAVIIFKVTYFSESYQFILFPTVVTLMSEYGLGLDALLECFIGCMLHSLTRISSYCGHNITSLLFGHKKKKWVDGISTKTIL